MLLLRIVAPADVAPQVVAYLDGLPDVTDLVHFPGVARRPAGDAIHCVVTLSAASAIIAALTELGVAARGSIALDRLDAALSSELGRDDGASADAVVWEEVEARTSVMSELSIAYLVYMMAATVLAAIAILTDSIVLIIGAMVVGPDFGPLCGLCVGLVHRRGALVRRAAISLGAGFGLAFAAAFVATWIFRLTGVAPDALSSAAHPATLFVSRPDTFAVVVAALAGIVGVLSLTTASSGTLIGVLISVTTIPAAGNAGVALAYAHPDELTGSLLQLGVNLAVMTLAGLVTLKLQRAAFTRRMTGFVAAAGVARLVRGKRGRRG